MVKKTVLKKYKKRQVEWIKKIKNHFQINGDKRSIQSEIAIELFSTICNILHIDYPKYEKYIRNSSTGKCYAYDFCYNKHIIEFNGDYWHCNPKNMINYFLTKQKNDCRRNLGV